MLRKVLASVGVLALLTLLLATAVQAAQTKYTFNDVVIDEETFEIEAAVKSNNKNDYSNCSYYADDYAEWLGNYQEDVVAGETAEEVLEFCITNFDNRTQ